MNETTPIWLIYFLCVMAGIGVSAAQVLPWSIIPDAIEWEEWHTGERNEGMFYSLITLMGKVGMMIIQPLGLLILKIFGFVSTDKSVTELVPQSPSALLGIRLVIGVLPALLLLTGIIMAIFYPLTRDEHHTIVEGLRLRREERKQKRDENKPLPGVKEPV
jgi:GPH family glycoside/pentoside/hexuronide:cation symporter